MHFLSLLFTSCIFLPIGYSQFNLFSPDTFEPDPSVQFAFDPTHLLEQPSIGNTNSPDLATDLNSDLFSNQDIELGSNFFLDNDVGPNQMLGSDPSSFLSENIFCDDNGVNANDFQLFGKIRRRDSCSTLLAGSAVQKDESDQETQIDLDKLVQFLQRPMPNFERSLDICPSKLYGLSNVPICDVPDITNFADTSSETGSTLLQNIYSVTKDPVRCQDVGAKIWCCMTVEPRKDIQIEPEKLDQVDAEQRELFNRVVKLLNNAFVCYPRRPTQPFVG